LWILARVLFNLTNPKTGVQKQLEELGHKEWSEDTVSYGKNYARLILVLQLENPTQICTSLGYIFDWKTN
jgi:hypothetical protein